MSDNKLKLKLQTQHSALSTQHSLAIAILFVLISGFVTFATQPKKIDFSKFSHKTHQGMVDGVLRKGKPQELNCAYCHAEPSPDRPKVTGYPNTKPGSAITHSACADCHAMQGRESTVTEATYPKMCVICHSSTRLSELKRNIRQFPNPDAGPGSQFYDNFSHLDHSGYFELSAAMKVRFKDRQKFKEKDYFECAACHENPAPGIKQSAPGHDECFVCHFNEKEVSRKRPTFATNCVGCHLTGKQEKGPGSELAVLRFERQIIEPELNNLQTIAAKSGAKPLKPFSHKTHEDAMGGNTKACLECHATAKRAEKRSDFFTPDRRTKVPQPRSESCVDCHRREMQTKIEGGSTIATAKCNYCHNLPLLEGRARLGIQLPPQSHFYKKPPPTPTPVPAPAQKPPPGGEKL